MGLKFTQYNLIFAIRPPTIAFSVSAKILVCAVDVGLGVGEDEDVDVGEGFIVGIGLEIGVIDVVLGVKIDGGEGIGAGVCFSMHPANIATIMIIATAIKLTAAFLFIFLSSS